MKGMRTQELIKQYKEAYKRAHGDDDCPYEIHCRQGVFFLEDPATGFDYQCRENELVRIISSLSSRTI
jgi:hypothetical protein